MFVFVLVIAVFICLASARPLVPRQDPSPELVAASWYAGWHSADVPPSAVSWDKYTHVTYAFAVTTPDITSLSLEDSDEATLPVFVQAAHDNGVDAMVSIGGWTGSRYFSSHVADATSRTTFVNTVLQLVSNYSLDGVDIDWEYPGGLIGLGCNVNSTSDTDNFLAFLQELRADPRAANLTISAAANIAPWVGPDLTPLTNVSAFADVLDYVAIMNYDVWGLFSPTAGPNAPLNDTCAPAGSRGGSAVSAVAAWTAAGMPASQIVLGMAAYGHGYSVPRASAFVAANGTAGDNAQTVLAPFPAFDAAVDVVGDKWDGAPGTDVCGVTSTMHSGVFDFFGLIDAGFLNENGTVADGIDYTFDECSQTGEPATFPYVYNSSTNVLVSYDDAQSFTAKGNFIQSAGLRGFAIWETAGDYNDILLDAVLSSAGFDMSTGGC